VLLSTAGDLNNWHWSEESTEAEIRKANGDFLAEVKYLKEKAPSAFVVFTEVHGYKYSSFYLFDELFCTFHIIFSHAGDLNNWHWSEESTEAEIRKANGDFLAEVKYFLI